MKMVSGEKLVTAMCSRYLSRSTAMPRSSVGSPTMIGACGCQPLRGMIHPLTASLIVILAVGIGG